MKFFVIGATGFVGTHLAGFLARNKQEVTVLTRRPVSFEDAPGVRSVSGNALKTGDWLKSAAECDVIVNLLGRSIMARWHDSVKADILESRVVSTRLAVEAACMKPEGKVFICASAVGIFGDRGDEELDDASAPGDGFLAEVCKSWESEAAKAESCGVRRVSARFGAVLGRGGGALAAMLPPFKAGFGGKLGSGRQWFSWIHVRDLCRAVLFCAQNENLSGGVNFTAPNPITNRELTATLGRVLRRPAVLPVPEFVLKILYGELADTLLTGQRVLPAALTGAGFGFEFPDPESALRDLTG